MDPMENQVRIGRLVFLQLWIVSFTIAFDVVGDLKLADLLFVPAVFLFRHEFRRALLADDIFVRAAIGLTIVVAWASLLTIALNPAPLWPLVVALRFFRHVSYIAIVPAIRYANLSKGGVRYLFGTIVVAILVQAVLVVLQRFGFVPVLWPARELAYHPREFSGTLYLNHLNSVLFMLVGLASTIGIVLANPVLRNLLFFILPVVLMVHAMLIGRARTSFVALAAFVLMLVRRARTLFLLLLLVCIAIPVLSTSRLDVIKNMRELWQQRVLDRLKTRRIESLDNLAELGASRTEIWKETLAGIAAKPYVLVTGAGFQNFSHVNRNAVAAHNQYLHVLVELGLGGLFFYSWLVWALWRQLAAMGRKSRELYYLISLPGTACLAAVLVAGILNETFYSSRAIPGFMGFFLAYVAVGTHRAWLVEESIAVANPS